MPMCEKCWSDAYRRAYPSGSQAEEYRLLLEERKNKPCSPRDQAGQWWDEERQCDMRNIGDGGVE